MMSKAASAGLKWNTNDVHWVKALVDPQNRDVFAFQAHCALEPRGRSRTLVG